MARLLVHFSPVATLGQTNKSKRVALCGEHTVVGGSPIGSSNKAHVTCKWCKSWPGYESFPASQVTP